MKLVLCGPPGVGKTTAAQRLRDRLAERRQEFRLLHSDDFSRDTYPQMYERVMEADSETVCDSKSDYVRDTAWILDGTFYSREWQARFRALPETHLVVLTASLETALERNRDREDSIDERGVRAMHAKFETPDSPDLTLNTEELSVEEAVDALERYVLTWDERR